MSTSSARAESAARRSGWNTGSDTLANLAVGRLLQAPAWHDVSPPVFFDCRGDPINFAHPHRIVQRPAYPEIQDRPGGVLVEQIFSCTGGVLGPHLADNEHSAIEAVRYERFVAKLAGVE